MTAGTLEFGIEPPSALQGHVVTAEDIDRKIRINVMKGEDSAQNAQRHGAVVDFLITGEFCSALCQGVFPGKTM